MKKTSYLFVGLLMVGCSPKVGVNFTNPYPMLEPDDEVVVIERYDPAPENADKIGSIKVGDTGFTLGKNGTYEKVMNIIDVRSREVGGNVIKITDHLAPDFFSTVHRVNADLYHIDNIKDLKYNSSGVTDNTHRSEMNQGDGGPEYGAVRAVAEYEPDWNWSISADVGYGRRLGKISSDLDASERALVKHLMSGVSYNLQALYYINSKIGLGLKYNDLRLSNEEYGTLSFDNGTSETGTFGMKIDLWYAGPVMSFRFPSDDGNSMAFIEYGLGLAGYSGKNTINGKSETNVGTDVGYLLNAGYHISVTEHLTAGVSASITLGSVRNFRYTDFYGNDTTVNLEVENSENINTFSIGLGLRWLF
ncbi:MAG: hypothetical protein IK006_02595 [Bacteroidaceae bacterium]|nr:hypothetical protein [Bacteroidaceae bacterium]